MDVDTFNNPELFDAHVHTETADANPLAALRIAGERKLRIGLVDHVFEDRNLIMASPMKAVCRKRFGDLQYLHGCETDVCLGGRVALTDEQLAEMDFVITAFTHLENSAVLANLGVIDETSVGIRIMELLETAIDYPHTDVIAHPFSFYLPNIDNWRCISSIPESFIVKQIKRIREKKILVEINARTLRAKPLRPQEYFIELANKHKCLFTVSSDAHTLAEIGSTEEAWKLIRRLNIPKDQIRFPRKRTK